MSDDDPLIVALRKRLPDAGIIAATTGVIEKFDLLSDGNRQFGASVYIQSQASDRPALGDLHRGRDLRPGHRESFPCCDLLCRQDEGSVIVVVASHDGSELSRRLSCAISPTGTYDEALFLWCGPQEYICTPWHDGDPERQVISVDGLRAYAAAWEPPKPSA